MSKIILSVLIIVLLGGCNQYAPEPAALTPQQEAAKAKAMVLCAGCHGPEGIGTAGFNPNLACQKKEYMVRQLNFYRDGSRTTHPPMTNIARMLSEVEVEAISEWYSTTGCNSL